MVTIAPSIAGVKVKGHPPPPYPFLLLGLNRLLLLLSGPITEMCCVCICTQQHLRLCTATVSREKKNVIGPEWNFVTNYCLILQGKINLSAGENLLFSICWMFDFNGEEWNLVLPFAMKAWQQILGTKANECNTIRHLVLQYDFWQWTLCFSCFWRQAELLKPL